MLKLSLFEFIVRGIPEQFLFVLAIHAFSKTAINLNKYLISGVLTAVMTYLIRLLPIEYGIHSLLGIVMLIIVVSSINKIDIIKAIRGGVITFILCFTFEGINIAFIQFILKKDINDIMSNNILKTLTGLPSLIILGIVIIVYYYRLWKRKELHYV